MFAREILAIHPPREVEQKLLKRPLEEEQIALLAALTNLVNPPARPRVDGRIHVGEIPLVSRNLAVRMHVPFTQKEEQLLLCKLRIDARHRYHVEGEIPRGVPPLFPLVPLRNH